MFDWLFGKVAKATFATAVPVVLAVVTTFFPQYVALIGAVGAALAGLGVYVVPNKD